MNSVYAYPQTEVSLGDSTGTHKLLFERYERLAERRSTIAVRICQAGKEWPVTSYHAYPLSGNHDMVEI